MRIFRMNDVEEIEKRLKNNETVTVEWKEPYEKEHNIGTVTNVRWDGLVFTTGGCIYTGISKLVEIR